MTPVVRSALGWTTMAKKCGRRTVIRYVNGRQNDSENRCDYFHRYREADV
jgi:hypothetical protein